MAFCASRGNDHGQAASCPNCGTPQGYSAKPAAGTNSKTLAAALTLFSVFTLGFGALMFFRLIKD
jgi:hypothetical protein